MRTRGGRAYRLEHGLLFFHALVHLLADLHLWPGETQGELFEWITLPLSTSIFSTHSLHDFLRSGNGHGALLLRVLQQQAEKVNQQARAV